MLEFHKIAQRDLCVCAETTRNFVVRTLNDLVRDGKVETSWRWMGTKDLSRSSMDAFTRKHVLPTIVTTCEATTKTIAEIWDLAPFTAFDAYDECHYGNVWCHASGNTCALVPPAVLTHTEHHKTKKLSVRTNTTLTINVLRWDGTMFSIDSSFRGRKKKSKKEGEGMVWASTKAHRLTKLFIWRRDESLEQASAIETVRETLWRLKGRLTSLANLAAIKHPPAKANITVEAMQNNLALLEEGVGKAKEAASKLAGPGVACEDEDDNTAIFEGFEMTIIACTNEASLCRERLKKLVRTEEIFGFTFHPDTGCSNSSCSARPIIGWRYHCAACNVDLCSKAKCIASHPLDHPLTLIRSPAPTSESAAVAAAETQLWVVNSIMDRWPLKRKRGSKEERQYLYHVNWQGEGLTPTWETAESLNNPGMLARYNEQFSKTQQQRGRAARDDSRYM